MKEFSTVTGNDELVSAVMNVRKGLDRVQVLTDQKRHSLLVEAEARLREAEAMVHMGHVPEREWLDTDGVMVTLETVDHMNRVVDKFIEVMDAAVETLLVDSAEHKPIGMLS